MTRLGTLVLGTIVSASVTCAQQSVSGDHFALYIKCNPIHLDATDPYPGFELDGRSTGDALRNLVERQLTKAGIELDQGKRAKGRLVVTVDVYSAEFPVRLDFYRQVYNFDNYIAGEARTWSDHYAGANEPMAIGSAVRLLLDHFAAVFKQVNQRSC